MDNLEQKLYKSELVYKSFGIIHIHTFCAQQITDRCFQTDGFIKKFDDPIDAEIFTCNLPFYKRYELEGFDVKITIDNDAILEGHVYVRAIKFFDNCMQISYRFVVFDYKSAHPSRYCLTNRYFNTDQLIKSASLLQKLEQWSVNKKTGKQTIDSGLESITFTGLRLSKTGAYIIPQDTQEITFEDVINRYKAYFVSQNELKETSSDLYHTYIDVCHDVEQNGRCEFKNLSESDIITQISTHHKSELIGLMTLYPQEWVYRDENSFDDICGRNIAIDTDDLVFTNRNFTLVIGTYGRRDTWTEHLKRRDAYHVCWPEYLVLIEMLLAKKQTINYAVSRYIEKSNLIQRKHTRQIIEDNAKLSIELSDTILKLNSTRFLRYMSHKHMFQLAEKNLGISEDQHYLNDVISRIDNSLNNANNSIEIRNARNTNFILLLISVASLFGVLLQNHEVPFIPEALLDDAAMTTGEIVAGILLSITAAAILIGFVKLIISAISWLVSAVDRNQTVKLLSEYFVRIFKIKPNGCK